MAKTKNKKTDFHKENGGLDAIQRLMDGQEWDSDTMTSVAEIVRSTGRKIACFKTLPEAKAFIRGIQFQNRIVTHLAKSL